MNWVTRHQIIFLSSLQWGAVPVWKFPDDDGPSVRQFLTDGPLFSVFPHDLPWEKSTDRCSDWSGTLKELFTDWIQKKSKNSEKII